MAFGTIIKTTPYVGSYLYSGCLDGRTLWAGLHGGALIYQLSLV